MGSIPARQAGRLIERCHSLIASVALAMILVQRSQHRHADQV